MFIKNRVGAKRARRLCHIVNSKKTEANILAGTKESK
jgi:hypothetical protein